MPKEGYVCKAQNSVCLLYLPQEISKTVLIETITDTSVRPKLASYEILITPIVRISCEKSSSLEKPAIIELVKTLQLADEETNNKVIPLCASSDSSEWRESGSECRVLKNHISFQVTHFSLYAVISRKRYPSSTVRVKPSTDILAPHHSSTSTELAIPELPGFKVQIPPSSINANRETDITATVLYDSPVVCSEDDRSRLASSCIELGPHGITFSKAISISLPISDYAEVKKNHPNAQLQIWHTNNLTKLEWNVIEYSIHRDVEGQDVAIVLTEHFSWYKPMWDAYNWTRSLFYAPQFSIKERCQVFMSQETQLQPSQDITFSIAILFYPYKEDPEPVPCNYKYTLLDSGLLDIHATNDDTLQFEVQLNEQLSPKKYKSIAGSLIISGRQQKSFIVELDRQVKLQENFPMGELSVGVREHIYHTLSLIKVSSCTISYNS